ncbi:ABC transporter permease [Arthrobacter silviterrae]|uniref:ABC transporter permease n=1 Tax=Arthrobacter silviterrae TaxID=2026658 RepID=A0ABX0DCR1_9MICC|nr:ABC transporter permease [Arthrobacter silviterrae]NGN84679.1 ABC transporter permease [Arthrobacter silviterrae]
MGSFLSTRSADIAASATEHLVVVLVSLLIATVIGVGIGILVWDRPISRSLAIASAGVGLTIPSMALLALLIPILGLGWLPTIVGLAFYALLPIIRNTVVGLQEVPAAVSESARGMGMGTTKTLFLVQLPMAWPVVLTGVRVSAQLTMGIAAIAAYVGGPGLGEMIFKGLSSLGSRNAVNYAVVGTAGVIILALLLDAAFVAIRRLTTSRGLRV